MELFFGSIAAVNPAKLEPSTTIFYFDAFAYLHRHRGERSIPGGARKIDAAREPSPEMVALNRRR